MLIPWTSRVLVKVGHDTAIQVMLMLITLTSKFLKKIGHDPDIQCYFDGYPLDFDELGHDLDIPYC